MGGWGPVAGMAGSAAGGYAALQLGANAADAVSANVSVPPPFRESVTLTSPTIEIAPFPTAGDEGDVPGDALTLGVSAVYQQTVGFGNTVLADPLPKMPSAEGLIVNVKVINSNMPHASERAFERVGFTSQSEARSALQAFGKNIETNGIPIDAISDPAHANRLIIPGLGNGGAVVYQKTESNKLRLKTVLEWKEPSTDE